MTAIRRPVLSCDSPNCGSAVWTLDSWTVNELRRKAKARGWVVFDRKDWCPRHAELLGVAAVS